MSALYDLYQPGRSWLHRLDPRTKMLFTVCGFVVLLTMRNLWVLCGALLLMHAMLISARVSVARIAWVWRMLWPTMIMIALLWALVYPEQERHLISIWFIRLGPHNLAEGLAVALRIGALAFCAFVWLFSTDQSMLVRGLMGLGMPYTWGLTIAMSLRYLPTMASVFQMICDAQQARALDLTRGNPLRRARSYLPIAVAMLITALRMAQNLARALESRALGAARTYLRRIRFSWRDWLFVLILTLTIGAMLWARFALGFGADALRLVGR